MSWEDLRTNYTDAVWSGLKKYIQISNSDGTVSFQDVTAYTQQENSFFGANDANQMNAAINELMPNAIRGVKANGTLLTPDANKVVNVTPSNLGAATTSHTHSASNITSGTLPISRGGTGATSASAVADSLLFVSRPNASTICSVYASGSITVNVERGFACLIDNLPGGNNWVASVTTWSEDKSDYYPHYVAATIAYSGSIWLKFESEFNAGPIRVSYVIFTIQ